MRAFYVIGFLLLMLFDTLAQVCFKIAGTLALPVEPTLDWALRLFSHPWAYGAIAGYIGAFFTWLTLLRHAPVGPAFAAKLFHEPVTLLRTAGALLILGGILCLGYAETPDPAQALAEG